jgi:hypothetical protein
MSGLKQPPIVLPLRLTRTLVDRLSPRVDERGPVMLEDPSRSSTTELRLGSLSGSTRRALSGSSPRDP